MKSAIMKFVLGSLLGGMASLAMPVESTAEACSYPAIGCPCLLGSWTWCAVIRGQCQAIASCGES